MTLPVPPPALGRLLEHQGFVERLARQLCLDESSAQDLQQETWLVALRHPPRHETSPRGWLATVMRNLHFRRRKQDAARATQEVRGFERSDRSVLRPDEELAVAQARSRMGAALGRLPAHYQEAVRLRFEEGLPPRELGQRLGIEPEQARSRVRRAVKMLRSDLDEGGERRDWLAGMTLLAAPGQQLVPEKATTPALLVMAVGLAASLLLWLTLGPEAEEPSSLSNETANSASLVTTLESNRRTERNEVNSVESVPVETAPPSVESSTVRVSGIVLKRGVPVPHARILVTDDSGWSVRFLENADAEGRFELEGLPRGSWLGAAALKFRSGLVWLEGPMEGRTIELQLDMQTTLYKGQVFEPDGRPAVDAAFEMSGEATLFAMFDADGLRRRGSLPNSARTDHEGRYTIRYDGRGVRHRLRVSSQEGEWVGRLRGDDEIHLTEFAESSPVEEESSAEVFLEGSIPPGPRYIVFEASSCLEVLPVDEAGHFAASVPAQPASLMTWQAGRAPVLFAFTDGLGNIELLDEEARRTGELKIVVHGTDPSPTTPYTLEYLHPSSSLVVMVTKLQGGEPSDQAGEARVKDLAPGYWRVTQRSKYHIREQRIVHVRSGEVALADFRPTVGHTVKVMLQTQAALPAQERLDLSIWDERGELIVEEPVWMPTGEDHIALGWRLPAGNNRIQAEGEFGAMGEIEFLVEEFPEGLRNVTRVTLDLDRPHSEHDETAVKAE